jgi:hypothetical protein
MRARQSFCVLILCLVLPTATHGEEDANPSVPTFQEGDVIDLESIDALRPYLPPEFWAHRDFFFYEGMQLEIGPFHRDYSEAPEYLRASERYAGQARLGPQGSLLGYVAGRPFDPEAIDCEEDPDAGAKIAWNLDYRWNGDGSRARFYYSYWDRGEELPLYYEGTSKTIQLSHRVEPDLIEESAGDLFRRERRKHAFGVEVVAPFEARGVQLLTYRYKTADARPADADNDDMWVYVPTLRRTRRISAAQRTDAVSGTDFTLDDLRSFSGIVPQFDWECLGEQTLLAPMNSRASGFPYSRDHAFGPYGLSYADDVWELRHAIKIRFRPRNPDHPYAWKDLYLDRQTLTPLYAFAYDQKGELWKILWHNHRFSEDDLIETGEDRWYAGWKGVPEPRDLRIVSDTIVNVQTGTGNRIEFWDDHGTPFKSKGRARRYIDVGRLDRSSR